MAKVFMYDPYTGRPRHPSDIASDPEGLLIVDDSDPITVQVPHTVDCVGLALDLEARAKTVESQTTERAMESAAHGLRLLAASQARLTRAADALYEMYVAATVEIERLTAADRVR